MLRRLFGSRTRHRYGVGIEHFNAGRARDAVTVFDEILEGADDPADPDLTLARFYRAEAYARLGREALDDGDAARALPHFDAALVEHPSYPDLHLHRATCLLETGDPLAAERAAMQALELAPELVEASLVRMIALVEQGRTDRAREVAERGGAVARARGDALAPLFGDPASAHDGFRVARRRRHERRRAIERIESLLHEGMWSKAESMLATLLEETPEYPDLRLRMAACRAAVDDPAAAAAHLDVALERNPDFTDGRVLAGIVHLRRSNVVLAREHFEHARRLGHRSTPLLYGSALCELRLGHPDRAFEALEEVWRVERPGSEARGLRAGLLALTGRTRDAEEAYVELVDGTEASPLLLDAVAWGLHMGRHDLVRRALDALPPGPPEAASALARTELLARSNETERAIDVLEAATADLPDHPAILWMLARMHAVQGHVDVALRRLANLDALGHEAPAARALRGRLLRERGDLDASLQVLRETPGDSADPDAALESLFTARAMGETDLAARIWSRWSPLTELEPRWRIQDPARWWKPLPVWPTREGDAGSA